MCPSVLYWHIVERHKQTYDWDSHRCHFGSSILITSLMSSSTCPSPLTNQLFFWVIWQNQIHVHVWQGDNTRPPPPNSAKCNQSMSASTLHATFAVACSSSYKQAMWGSCDFLPLRCHLLLGPCVICEIAFAFAGTFETKTPCKGTFKAALRGDQLICNGFY